MTPASHVSAAALAACLLAFPAAHGSPNKSSNAHNPLVPHLKVGDHFGDLFSRTIAYRISGFDDIVRRASGNADYVVTAASPAALRFSTTGRYDGAADFQGITEIHDSGATTCWNAKCSPTTDGSGLLYNARLWGPPPSSFKVGMTWTVNISAPWELGPPGREHVTVLALDAGHHRITLQREGTGDGYFDNDTHRLTLKKGAQSAPAEVTPGPAHWIGQTTFQDSIVISDELMVERSLTLTSKEWGTLPANQREYILLNATPSAAN